MYYIAGWIAQAIRATGEDRGENSTIGIKLQEVGKAIWYPIFSKFNPTLPTKLVCQVQALGNFKFATKPSLLFVCYLEAICIECLTPVNQLLYSNAMLQELFQLLFPNEHLLEIFKSKTIRAVNMDADMIQEC
jgi:hypothetical protein